MENLQENVIKAIDQIRPALQNDGGDVEFVSMEDKVVKVKLVGACAGCPMSQMTLKSGIEKYLKHAVDQDLVVENAILF